MRQNGNDKNMVNGYQSKMIATALSKPRNKAVFFKLKFVYKDVTVLIPTNKRNEAAGIRYLSSLAKIETAFNELYKIPCKKISASDYSPSSWNKRNKDYQLKIQGGDLIDIAKIYRDLMYSSRDKELSFGEKKILQTAKDLLVEEILLVRKERREEVIEKLQVPFQQLGFGGEFTQSTTSSIL